MESNSNIGKIVLYVKIYKVAFLSENDDDKDELWTSQLKINDRNNPVTIPKSHNNPFSSKLQESVIKDLP